MNAHSPVRPDAVTISKELEAGTDPLVLYKALSDQGRRPGTMLFEQADGLALILESAAVRIECRGQDILLVALTANGERLLELMAVRARDRVRRHSTDRLELRFEKVDEPDCEARLTAPSPFDVLRMVTSDLSCSGGAEPFGRLILGIIAFDHVDLFEDLPANAEDPLGFPDFLFWVPETLILFEQGKPPRAICTNFAGASANADEASHRLSDLTRRLRSQSRPVSPPLLTPPQTDGPAEVDLDDRAFARLVTGLKEHIAAGDVYQIVASRTFSAPCADPFAAFAKLRQLDPSPYSFFVSDARFHLFGASPETSVRVFDDEGLNVELKPIAGTRLRGRNPDEDDRLEAELRLDPKELAEHMMLVDLARNDVARISAPGTRRVSQMMAVERYARVMHLVSQVTGKLRHGLDAIHALKACLNMGTLTGAPKIRATALLRQAERTKRGPYGGMIGWLNGEGTMDSAIVIRTAIVKDGIAYVRAGAGIVHDSDPMAEADETRRKASALLSVLLGA